MGLGGLLLHVGPTYNIYLRITYATCHIRAYVHTYVLRT